jgi:hypothetical protein
MGITKMVNVSVGPLHPFEKPETWMLAVVATTPIFSAAKGAIEPTPEVTRPILGLLLNQLIIDPGIFDVRLISGVVVPWQKVRLGLSVILGAGLTRKLNKTGLPAQPIIVGIMLIFADCITLVLLTAGNAGIADTGIVLNVGKPMKVVKYDQKNSVFGLGPLRGIILVY